MSKLQKDFDADDKNYQDLKPINKRQKTIDKKAKKSFTSEIEMKLKKDFKQSIYEHFLCMFIKEIAAFSPTTIHNYDALNQIVT